MELNWSTFLLELINFLVLVWILRRFLYKPVLDVIAARRKSIDDQLAHAKGIEAEACVMKQEYTDRLSDWESQKSAAREQLAAELDTERARRLAETATAIEEERRKADVAEQRRLEEFRRATQRQAMEQAAAFSSRLLRLATGPELEDRLLNLLIEELAGLPQPQLTRVREQWAADSQAIDVSSAFVLSDTQRQRLTSALQGMFGQTARLEFRRDEALIAGLRIVVGAWTLAVNVRDELSGFTDIARASI